MSKFCEFPFMNTNLIWNQTIPIISGCFKNIIFRFIPCCIIIPLSIIELVCIRNKPSRKAPWTILNLLKIFLNILLIVVNLSELIYLLLNNQLQNSKIQFISPILEVISFMLVIIVTLCHRSKNIHTSVIILIFWLFFALFDLTNFVLNLLHLMYKDESNIGKQDISFLYICEIVHTPLVVSSLILNSFSDYKLDQSKKSCPINRASVLSKLTFWWFNSLTWQGFKKPLKETDLWNLDEEFFTELLNEKFQQYWNPHCASKKQDFKYMDGKNKKKKHFKPRLNQNNVNIIMPLLKTFKYEILIVILYKFFGSILTFLNPFLLSCLIIFMNSNEPVWHGYLYAFGMFLAAMLESIFLNQYEHYVNLLSIKIKSILTITIYKKTLNLSSKSRKNFTTGEIVNMMSVDVQRVIEYVVLVNTIWSSILQIMISIYLLWMQLKLATLAGITVILLLIPCNIIVSRTFKSSQNKLMSNKDKRSKILNEVLNGIKVLKLYSWEDAFYNKINLIREKEISCLKKIMIAFACVVFVLNTSPFLVSMASFFTYNLIEDEIFDANKIFVSMTLFNIIRIPLGMVPFLIGNGAMCWISIQRINKYLSGEDLEMNIIETNTLDKTYAIKISDASFKWEKDLKPSLNDIEFSVKKKKLVAVIGTIGSGKSSLLSALLGDLYKIKGKVLVDGSISYVPQQAWIQNNTLKNNILFMKEFNKNKYDEIIDKAQLLPDLKILSAADETEIGEKGINLSGGQKQRISIARAVYSNKDIYLLDDPLSALDSNVSKEIFDKIISHDGILRNKTRILVTHRLSVLPKVDYIFVMKDGKIFEQGTYNDLLVKKGYFSELIYQFLKESQDSKENDLNLVNEIQDSKPELKRKISQLSTKIDSLSVDSSKFGASFKHKKLEKSSSIISKTSIQFEQDKIIEDQQRLHSIKLKNKGELIAAEHVEIGSVKFSIYWNYLKALGLKSYFITIFAYTISHSFNLMQSLWLSEWSNDSLDINNLNNTDLLNKRMLGYFSYGVTEAFFVLIATFILCLGCLSAAKKIHYKMLKNIFLTPLSFFDVTPTGRLMNRFTKDIDIIDFGININVRGMIIYIFRSLVVFTLISIETPYFLVLSIPIIFFYIVLQKLYVASSRQLKRLESVTRSPIYSHFQETISGVQCIRAYGYVDRFIIKCCEKIDINTKFSYVNLVAIRWLTVRLEFLGYLIVFLSALFAVISKDTLSSGLAGVTISSALTITNTLNLLMKSYSDLETNLVCVERCLEYTTLDHEKPMEISENKPNKEWPELGVIEFRNYSTKYRKELDLVLKNVTFTINKNEKIGVVGRTGAGKSSLTLALFRIIESVNGYIFIDEIDIAKLGLHDLRKRLTIIPQDPVLFTGTLRMNLDPFNEYTDSDLWKVLEQSHLSDLFVNSLGLDFVIAEGGENVSVGQGQLICLARALLRKTKILVLDEATAAVDLETDELIQNTIRKEFSKCTIVTIAHRINTIMDYDKVLVLDKGQVAEFNSPKKLLENDKTIFYSMAKNSGII